MMLQVLKIGRPLLSQNIHNRSRHPLLNTGFIRCFSDLKYQKSHEYINTKTFKIGITDFAQSQLGEVVYVDLPEVGDEIEKGDSFGSVESVKAASDVYMPISGEVLEINETLQSSPETVNTSPFEDGWFIKIKPTDKKQLDELMNEEAYRVHCDEESSDH